MNEQHSIVHMSGGLSSPLSTVHPERTRMQSGSCVRMEKTLDNRVYATNQAVKLVFLKKILSDELIHEDAIS